MLARLRLLHLLLGTAGSLLFVTDSFVIPSAIPAGRTASIPTVFSSTTDTTGTPAPAPSALAVPLSLDEMVRQAASAMKQAKEQGTTRQIVRILLPRDADADKFGRFFEDEASNKDSSSLSAGGTTLVPPDESWQGGIMQLYRAAAPTCEKMLRQLTSQSGLPPRINEDRSVDESGVDGVGLFTTEDGGSIQCFVQPTQELVDDYVVDASQKASDDQLVILLNPQWRQVDDALDSASQGEGFLSGLASFLGGKGATLKRLKEAGFRPVYTLEGYVCRGCNVRLLQILDSDWAIFYQDDDNESFVSVGTLPSETRPTYQQVDELLSKSGVGFKYAKDIGL